MKRGIQLTIFLGVVLFLLAACTQQAELGGETDTSTAEEEISSETSSTQCVEGVDCEDIIVEEEGTEELSSEATVEITSSGFSPSTLTVAQGTTVTFVNMDSAEHWPASASHPTHTVYPTEGGCIGSTFDACEGLAQGESFEFTFDEVGEWKYHDHKNPSNFGTIIVE